MGVGLILGVIAQLRHGTWIDYLTITVSILLVSVPTMVFALLIQQVFAGNLGLFPVIGWDAGDLSYSVLPTLAGSFAYIASYARLAKASLSFLGLGLKTPAISLGTLISDAQAVMELYPFELFYPSLVLCLIVLAFNLFGDGLRDALDPRMRR